MGGDRLLQHLRSGATTVCRAWAVVRGDGALLGFTDHDRDLDFEGITFRASTGMTARALQQSTGLSVDNSEAMGALSDAALTETDILAGRFDGAEVRAWLVNWANVSDRLLQFRGSIGEIQRAGGAFRAELRGLSEVLNRVSGRVYQRGCSAVLGDAACGFDLTLPGYIAERAAEMVENRILFRFATMTGFDDRWFERGRLSVLSGAAAGLCGVIKNDRLHGAAREVELWSALGAKIAPGDLLRLEAGCDRRGDTCRLKFNNFRNFRGFPHSPGEDWMTAFPSSGSMNDGGSLSR